MEAGGSLRRQSSLVADSLRGAPSHLVDPATGPNRGGQNWGNSVIESGEIPLILVIENATLYDASYIEIYEKVLGPAIRPDLYAPELRAQATEFQQALTEFYPRLRSTVTGR